MILRRSASVQTGLYVAVCTGRIVEMNLESTVTKFSNNLNKESYRK